MKNEKKKEMKQEEDKYTIEDNVPIGQVGCFGIKESCPSNKR